MNKLSVRDITVTGKRVLVRVDFNVPLQPDGSIRSDARIRAALPTIRFLLERKATVILISHLGKAKGQPDPAFSLRPVAIRLQELLGEPVRFLSEPIGPEVRAAIAKSPPSSILLLENLRFYPGETANDPDFSRQLAELGEIYVNDAFGVAHRAHASTTGVARLFAQPCAGLLLEKEIDFLSRVTESPRKPYVAVIGGAKVSDKAGVIANLLPKVDRMLIGGGAAFSFFRAWGLAIGKSIWEPELEATVRPLATNPKLLLPTDIVAAPAIDASDKATVVRADSIPTDQAGFDIGPDSCQQFAAALADAETVVWAGPLGVFEIDAFAHGTAAVAQAIATATARGATTVVGGGDTGAAVARLGLANQVSHISTGGSACLKFLEGTALPAIAALADK